MGKILGDGSRFALARPKGGGLDTPGGGDNFGGMEARIARLEEFAESTDKRLGLIEQDLRAFRGESDSKLAGLSTKIDSNFKWLLGVFAARFLVLAGALWTGYLRLDNKMDTNFAKVDAKIDVLSNRIDSRFQQMDAKIDAKFDKVDSKFDKIMERLPAPPAKPIK